MAFGDTLKSLLGIDVDMSGLKEVRFFGDGNKTALVNIENKTININIEAKDLKDPEKKKLLQNAIRSIVDDQEQPLLQADASQVVTQLNEGDVYTPIYDFFKNKLPPQDVIILRASLYVRMLHDEGRSIERQKTDIVTRYGQHGANVCNLSTAGYFESHIKPMYEELAKRPDFTLEKFTSSYVAIVDNAPFALFVSRAQPLDLLVQMTIEKIIFNKSYGIRQLTIHTIGNDNIVKVKALLEKDEVKRYFTDEPDILIQGAVMTVSLHYYQEGGAT